MIARRILLSSSLVCLASCGLLGGGTPVETSTPEARTTASGLRITDQRLGRGREAVNGAVLTVHYAGALADGSVFDSSYERGEPFVFTLGAGKVIPGWDEGLLGMREGGLRSLEIPPELAYGEQGVPPVIPPRARLAFRIELLRVDAP